MREKQVVKPAQIGALESPWSLGNRVLRLLWEFCWAVFCGWTPKPLNGWRLLWLKLFGAKIHGGSSPSGILIYHPAGATGLTPALLGTEFLTELVESFILVFLLSQTRLVSFGSRVGFVFLAGVFAAIATNIPYWNWYGFPTTYTLAYITIQIVSFLIVGLVAASVLRQRTPATSAAAA